MCIILDEIEMNSKVLFNRLQFECPDSVEVNTFDKSTKFINITIIIVIFFIIIIMKESL